MFLVVLLVGTPLFLYAASRVIMFTTYFTTEVEISRVDVNVSSADVYGALNRMDEFQAHPRECPNSMDSCWSMGGEVTLKDAPATGRHKRLKLSTGETTEIWTHPASPARHEAFVERVLEALRSEGFVAVAVEE
ncbi:hypothetical protein [Shimia sp. SK013]|uniref:hypothetical protein n=1 Tax=Shimia sp. SK013 TaxID=1389006 RepID=UPI00128F17AB|nr:hypothetical protein [Shimia sp. SK013]